MIMHGLIDFKGVYDYYVVAAQLKHIQHLYWRAGFGITPQQQKQTAKKQIDEIVDDLFTASNKWKKLEVDVSYLPKNPKELSKEQRKEFRKMNGDKIFELNVNWVKRLAETDATLREKMTLFWHNHFACRTKHPVLAQNLNNTIREHALGSFHDLVLAVSKEAAMLEFLNNKQNKKSHPNENFAREVMELFTIGRGNYTETDIKEAARAFTGWTFDQQGKFKFLSKRHDFGQKTFMGKTGNFNGEDIIAIILEQEKTSEYICRKLYRYFVNDAVNESHVAELAKVMRSNNYDVTTTLKALFTADWFYSDENIGCKIKSPIELLVGVNRQFNVVYEEPKTLLKLQKLMGQVLFYPPNVAGWPGGKNWIDSSTLMLRLKLPSVVLNAGIIEWHEKEDLSTNEAMLRQKMMEKTKRKTQKRFKAIPDWDSFLKHFDSNSKEELIAALIQPQLSKAADKVVAALNESDKKALVIELMSLPEYQLC
jgi:uncharacterized protein (DUF1800 family)